VRILDEKAELELEHDVLESKMESKEEKKKRFVCVVCPMGCAIDTKYADKDGEVKIKEVSGAECSRGKVYAELEVTKPVRTLTTTMRVIGGKKKLVPVKTSKPVPKNKIFACMEEINRSRVQAPVYVGQVLIKNIQNSGADVIATYEVEAWN